MINISLLSQDNLQEAGGLADQIFPQTKVLPSIGLAASLDKSLMIKLNHHNGGKFSWLRYWVATNLELKKIVGIVGLYEEYIGSADVCWLGWFCVDPPWRGQGIGELLLDFATVEAKKLGKKYLRLYTSTDPTEATAQLLYEKKGFSVLNEKQREKRGDSEIFYRQLLLNK